MRLEAGYERGDVSEDVMPWPSSISVTVAKRSTDLEELRNSGRGIDWDTNSV